MNPYAMKATQHVVYSNKHLLGTAEGDGASVSTPSSVKIMENNNNHTIHIIDATVIFYSIYFFSCLMQLLICYSNCLTTKI